MDQSVFVEALYGVKHLKSEAWEQTWVLLECIFQGCVHVLHDKKLFPFDRAIYSVLWHYWYFICILLHQVAIGKETGDRCFSFDYWALKLNYHNLLLQRVLI
jgi:hypothetical protein